MRQDSWFERFAPIVGLALLFIGLGLMTVMSCMDGDFSPLPAPSIVARWPM
jgi:hypothetical protein